MKLATRRRPQPSVPGGGQGGADVLRRHIRVRGVVQGVGFRPFVYRLARELQLAGCVRNDGQGVSIEVQGQADPLVRFLARLRSEAPAIARIDAVETTALAVRARTRFVIEGSASGAARTGIAPDSAVCDACLEELFDPSDRRYRHAFINCTQCGPRYTITRALPYDRPNTSMARFVQCVACQAEYDDAASRRFHAQPNACEHCGPRLTLAAHDGSPWVCSDAIGEALARLAHGEIVAIKGLGGFHLACDARNPQAVTRLRQRKGREEKPLAVMVASLASVGEFALLDARTARLLRSAERPIGLLPKSAGCDSALPGVAPGAGRVGVMLPYTPVHYLLFHAAAGSPSGTRWLTAPQSLALVMTSANPGGEPLVIGNDEGFERLRGIADAFLLHDRDILVGCDDSVVQAVEPHACCTTPHATLVRRARGYTPRAIRLPASGPSLLATGAWLKNTVCVTRGDEAFLSQHVGDLDNVATCLAMEQAVQHLLQVLEVEPAAVAHDLHPDFHSSRFAVQFAAAHGIPAYGVQHHHAHIASVLAEQGCTQAVLGLALDGAGLGNDGGAWGGELLHLEGAQMRRVGHLRALPLPGGERAAREPWRMACAALHLLGASAQIEARYATAAGAAVLRMLDCGFNCPPTTSAGRWFDAAAGLLQIQETASFEGQAAMLLEALALRHGPVAPWAGGFRIEGDGTLDLLPLLARLAQPIDAGYGAALFHATLAQALAQWIEGHARREGIAILALGGGCFVNAILSRSLCAALSGAGLQVLQAAQAPPNDGGLALGQAWVAMQRCFSATETEPTLRGA